MYKKEKCIGKGSTGRVCKYYINYYNRSINANAY